MDEDWTLLLSFFLREWVEPAVSSGALKGLRKDEDPESLLRVLPIHLGCVHSLRDAAGRGRIPDADLRRYDGPGARQDRCLVAHPLQRRHAGAGLQPFPDHSRRGQVNRGDVPAVSGFGEELRACRPRLLRGAGHRPCRGLRRPCRGPSRHRQPRLRRTGLITVRPQCCLVLAGPPRHGRILGRSDHQRGPGPRPDPRDPEVGKGQASRARPRSPKPPNAPNTRSCSPPSPATASTPTPSCSGNVCNGRWN